MSRPSAGTAMGGGLTGTGIAGFAQLAGALDFPTLAKVLFFVAPTATAVFVWLWPRILIRLERTAESGDIANIEDHLQKLALPADRLESIRGKLLERKMKFAAKLTES